MCSTSRSTGQVFFFRTRRINVALIDEIFGTTADDGTKFKKNSLSVSTSCTSKTKIGTASFDVTVRMCIEKKNERLSKKSNAMAVAVIVRNIFYCTPVLLTGLTNGSTHGIIGG